MIETANHDAPVTPAVKQDLEYAMKLLSNSKPECYDLLWSRFIFDLDYAELGADRDMTNDAVRMQIGRCLEEARKLFP